ncbi:dynein regulatory complex subunit 3 isoform X1 [Nerophis lumbriciformis]|uniref:dynein regulatory complex subunit 3 isoform X1 n=1 Tax=Nerophis lumbriciformis TaxID=546530 RepID=UPI002AE09590|nr:dynein regulatory complex subunit 3-like isoform X1 [Nerophis lumbriciformis]XP_061830320.1 dynein regulatory complex subunit 3-like isoform X1 [Nerophis lumbriciformis]
MSASKETPNMSCYHGASKPVYVDEELLQEAVLEQGLQDQAERIAKEEGIHYNDALRLSLEYRNIRRIDHLWEFTSLTKLNLNNNFIKKMEGLNHLVNLTWLNLSFNNIEKIEGLEGLQKLEVLKLSNNRISFVENMDNLVELTILCLANNLLQQLNNVVYLRRFKKLFTLNIEGNPIPEESCEDKYLIFIAAYFQQLKFLNNIFLNEDIRNRAHIKYNLDIEEMNQGELQRQQAVEENRKQEAELQRHEDAFVEQMNGSHLYNNIFQNDTEADKLHCLPGVDELLEVFEKNITDLCNQLFDVGLAEHKRREAEISLFFQRNEADVTKHQRIAFNRLTDFEKQHKQRIKELQELIDAKERKSQVDNCHKEINLLCYNLMTVEFQLYSHMEETIRKFDNNISEMTSSFSETAQGIFVHCRELEESHHKSIQQIANTTVEMVAKGESEDELPDDVRMLFLDKNTVTDTLAASHDNHVQTINDRETQLVTRAEAWKVALIKGIEDTELRRNRMRIADIHRYADYLRGQLEKFQ